MSDLQQCPCCGQPWREKVAPVQGYVPGIPWSIHLEAYAAYSKKWSPQPALIDLEGRNCRGGFGLSELDEFVPGWRERVSEIHSLRARIGELEAAHGVQASHQPHPKTVTRAKGPAMNDANPRDAFVREHLGEPWRPIDTGDRVKHGPTGEEWLVARVNGKHLFPCGWPPTRAEVGDCTLLKKATAAERQKLLQELAASQSEHAAWARDALGVPGS